MTVDGGWWPNSDVDALVTGTFDGKSEGLLSVLTSLRNAGSSGWSLEEAAELSHILVGIYTNGLNLQHGISQGPDMARLGHLQRQLERLMPHVQHGIADPALSECVIMATRIGIGTARSLAGSAGSIGVLQGAVAKNVAKHIASGPILAARGHRLHSDVLRELGDQSRALRILRDPSTGTLLKDAARVIQATGHGSPEHTTEYVVLNSMVATAPDPDSPGVIGKPVWPLVNSGLNLNPVVDSRDALDRLRTGLLKWAAGSDGPPEHRGFLLKVAVGVSVTTNKTPAEFGSFRRVSALVPCLDALRARIKTSTSGEALWYVCDRKTCSGRLGDVRVQAGEDMVRLEDYLIDHRLEDFWRKADLIKSGGGVCTKCQRRLRVRFIVDGDKAVWALRNQTVDEARTRQEREPELAGLLAAALDPAVPTIVALRNLQQAMAQR